MLSIFIAFKYRISNPHSKFAAMLDVKFIKSSMGEKTFSCLATLPFSEA